MPRYATGQPVRVSTEVRDTAGTLTPPGGILLRVKKPDGTFLADYASPVNDSTGKYHVDIPAVDVATLGHYAYAWITTGAAAGVSPPAAFEVVDPFTPTHVTFADARARLNLTAISDDEVQAMIAAAVAAQEQRVGPVAPRTLTQNADLSGDGLRLPTTPVLSVTSATLGGGSVSTTAWTVTASGQVNLGTGAVFGYGAGFWTTAAQRYVVTYVAGRSPVPQDLVEAALLRVEAAYDTQRGPAGMPLADEQDSGFGSSYPLLLRAEALEQPYVLGPGVA